MLCRGLGVTWRRQWHATPALLLGKSHGWQSLVGCCLWGLTESDTTEATQQQQHFKNLLFHSLNYFNFQILKQPCIPLQNLPWHDVMSSLCSLIDGSPPGSAIHGIFQARILEWAAISFSRLPPQETLKHSSVSVCMWSLGPGAQKACLSPLSISGRYGV